MAGDLADVLDPDTGRPLPPLAQIALDEGERVAGNLPSDMTGQPLRPFTCHNQGVVLAVGPRRGVADIAGPVLAGRLAPTLKELSEGEYRLSVEHLHGWSPMEAASRHVSAGWSSLPPCSGHSRVSITLTVVHGVGAESGSTSS